VFVILYISIVFHSLTLILYYTGAGTTAKHWQCQ